LIATAGVHVRFRTATAIIDATSNPPPLQFVPEISKLPQMLQQPVDCHNKRPLWCLLGLLLCRKKEKRKKLMV
jgi:hypothetical protein